MCRVEAVTVAVEDNHNLAKRQALPPRTENPTVTEGKTDRFNYGLGKTPPGRHHKQRQKTNDKLGVNGVLQFTWQTSIL